MDESLRYHWAIENNLKWNLDVIFKDDNQAKRNLTAIENANLTAKLSITIYNQEKKFQNLKTENA